MFRNTTSGIYQIKHITSGKIYVGSAVSIPKRWNMHRDCLNRNVHTNGRLQNAWNKYGEDNFEFTVLEYCSPKDLIRREQHYIDLLNPEYNIYKTAGSPLGTKQSDGTRAKVSAAMKGRIITDAHREKISQALKGMVRTKEHRQNISLSKLGSNLTAFAKEKISNSLKGNSRALGYEFTEEQKKKVSDGLKRARANGKIFGNNKSSKP